MWRELQNGTMTGRKICPIMSRPQGIVLCQGKHCAAAVSRRLNGESLWFCRIIEADRSSGEVEDHD